MLVFGMLWPRACGLSSLWNFSHEDPQNKSIANELPSTSVEPLVSAPPTTSILPQQAASTSPSTQSFANVTIGKSILMHCQDKPGVHIPASRCGELQLDTIVVPKLENFSTCPTAESVVGKLSLGVDVDFEQHTVRLIVGRSSALTFMGRRNDHKIDDLLNCVRPSLEEIGNKEAPAVHEHARYLLFYTVHFAPLTSAKPATPYAEKPASGTATVQVESVKVIDQPNASGTLVSRLSRGTTVSIVGTSGHWVHIRFNEQEPKEGWVFRTSIGR